MEIPSSEIDLDGPRTKDDAERMWKRYQKTQPRLIERFRHCIGCSYLRQAGGSYLVCCYLLLTGKKRPCAFGGKCKVKHTWDGFQLPDGYTEWCEELDMKETAHKTRRVGERGRRAEWDTTWAKSLLDRGFSISEVSEIMGVNLNTLSNYAIQHLWNYDEHGRKKKKQYPCHTREVIEAERKAWEKHRQEDG